MTRRLRIADLTAVAVPEQPALSPDGTQIVYVLRTQDADADKPVSRLWRVGTADGPPHQLTTGDADGSPAWSPDGSRIAFVRATDGPGQLWSLPADGGEPTQLTTLALGAGDPVWSPDGTRIAFTASVDIAAGADGPKEAAPIVTERLGYQADGAGFLGTMRMHLHVLDVEAGSVRQVTEGDWHAGRPAWSPDGGRLAFAAATADDADLNYRAGMFVVDAHLPAARPQRAGFEQGSAAAATWTSDGSALLVVGTAGPVTSMAGLFRVDAAGGDAVDLTASLDRTVMPGGPGYPGALPQLVDDGRAVLFCVRDRGCTHLYRLDLDGGAITPVLDGDARVVSGLSVAAGTAVVALSTATSFGEIVVVDLAGGTESVRTDHGAALSEVELFARESREFAISDGTTVQGWLVRDPQATGPQPVLLDIHGGPHNAWNGAADSVHLYHQELAARGWTVLFVNPRGSDGYGAAFYDGALGAWGEADAKDVLEPLDELVAEGVADAARLAVTGYSYGGYLTCYLTSRDQRFAAAVAGGVVSDLVSLAGTAEAGHVLSEIELDALPWRNQQRLAELSPLTEVGNVRTPTLVLHGADDRACPIGQAQQWHSALRERGVATTLTVYPGASHLFILNGRPSHRVDYNQRVLDWVLQYAGDERGARRAKIDAAHWQRRLAVLAERHNVPGAQLGILRLAGESAEEELVAVPFGTLNVDTGVAATADSVFQIGSVSKVWTATVAMQLVDEGLLELDAPIIEVLPDLRLSDPDVTKRVTLRHLLAHTSGIDGDVFTDTGRGDDCLERYAALLADAAQIYPLGATWSYCNAGFSLIGRLIEKVTDQTWDAAMKQRLFDPLGLEHTVTLPEDALLHGAAVGHVHEGMDTPTRAPVWQLPRSLGPAGLITARAADVLAFARLHLTGGVAADGSRVLAGATAAAMADKQADLPDKYTLGDSWGLGWIRYGWDDHRLIGHDGNTIGQAAFLRLLPEQGLAVTLLTNGGNTRDLYQELYREIFAELADVEMPEPLAPPDEPVEVDATAWVGTYERESVRTEVLRGDEGYRLRTTVTGPLAELMPDPVEEYPMVAVRENLFVVRPPDTQTWTPVTFYALPSGEQFVHFGARATPKVG